MTIDALPSVNVQLDQATAWLPFDAGESEDVRDRLTKDVTKARPFPICADGHDSCNLCT